MLYKLAHHPAVIKQLKRKGFTPDPEKLRDAVRSISEQEENEEILSTLIEVGWI